ncbi:MAG: hypothetical protein Tsb0021_01090 [Chlamydiales bacterium]
MDNLIEEYRYLLSALKLHCYSNLPSSLNPLNTEPLPSLNAQAEESGSSKVPSITSHNPKPMKPSTKQESLKKNNPEEKALPAKDSLAASPSRISLNPVKTQVTSDVFVLAEDIHRVLPNVKIVNSIPDDALGKEKSALWKTLGNALDFLIITKSEKREIQELVNNICKAVQAKNKRGKLLTISTDHLLPTSKIRAKLVLFHTSTKEFLPKLLEEFESTNFIEINQWEAYLNDVGQKKTLWRAICTALEI